MQQALADFRIESDRVIFLTFADGRSCRVSPGDLGRFLNQDDVRRVRRALRLRRQFMRRVLPPTAIILLVVGIIGFGRYDIDRISHSWLAPAPAAERQPSMQAPVSTLPPSGVRSTSSSSAPTATSPAKAGTPATPQATSGKQVVPAAKGPQSQPTKGTHPTPSNSAPVTSPVNVVVPVLAPVAAPVRGTVHQLSKLLP